MKGLVVYNGTYGSTEQYAVWIGDSLGIPVRSAKAVSEDELVQADYLVIGSSIHAGKLTVAGKLKRWWPVVAKKKVFFYTTSGVPPSKRDELERAMNASLPERLGNHGYFPAGGRIDYSKYSPIMKWLMTAIGKSEFKKHNPGKPVPSDIGKSVMDSVDRKWIEPLVAEAKALR